MAAKYPQLGDDKNFLLLTGELLFQPKGQTGYINLGPLTMHQITPTTEKKTVVRSLRFNPKRTVREIARDPAYIKQVQALGANAVASESPQAFKAFMTAQRSLWDKVVADAKIPKTD